jgi:hypothetical protein
MCGKFWRSGECSPQNFKICFASRVVAENCGSRRKLWVRYKEIASLGEAKENELVRVG